MDYVSERYGPRDSGYDLDHCLRPLLRAAPTKEYLAGIKAPVLILSGEGEKYFSVKSAEEWRDALLEVGVDADLRIVFLAPTLLCYMQTTIANRFLLQFIGTRVKL
ncbi:hypothetical protein RQP46_009850 [Phenoliferia psychrophenolica]